MTEGERFVSELPTKTTFHDRSKRRSYNLTREVGVRLIDEPDLIENGRSFLELHVRPDPSQERYYLMWKHLLTRDVKELVRLMLEDTPSGDLLRDTQPVFVVLTPEERRKLSRLPEAELQRGSDRPSPL